MDGGGDDQGDGRVIPLHNPAPFGVEGGELPFSQLRRKEFGGGRLQHHQVAQAEGGGEMNHARMGLSGLQSRLKPKPLLRSDS